MTHPDTPTRIGDAGLRLLKAFEGLVLYTYDDFDPKREKTFIREFDDAVWGGTLTIGHGHTGHAAIPGNKITRDEAEELLQQDLRWAEQAVASAVDVYLRQVQFDALVSFVYNVGGANFRRSTLLKRLNQGKDYAAAEEFDRWVFSKGKRLAGLERRRAAERELFLSCPSSF